MENRKKNLLLKKVKVFINEIYLYFLEAYAWNAIKFKRNDMSTKFLQQILSGRLLLVVIIRTKK